MENPKHATLLELAQLLEQHGYQLWAAGWEKYFNPDGGGIRLIVSSACKLQIVQTQ